VWGRKDLEVVAILGKDVEDFFVRVARDRTAIGAAGAKFKPPGVHVERISNCSPMNKPVAATSVSNVAAQVPSVFVIDVEAVTKLDA
jgi:hypothetical protein